MSHLTYEHKLKILTILGARPQFIKASMVSRELSRHPELEEIIVHTGQHFDENMSDIFFNQMGIREPKYNLDINSLGHGAMTGRMLEKIETVLKEEMPDWVLVYGDTNSTLAGALAAKKLYIRVAHVEAGLRSFNMRMPEEINRILTDRISDILFCPTVQAVQNLKKEGFTQFDSQIVRCGDVMYDAALYYAQMVKKPGIELSEKYNLLTLHRQENTDDLDNLQSIITAINEISREIPIVFPVHPRTRQILAKNNIELADTVVAIDPVGYLEMLYLLKNCRLVMTDSGGLQKEAYFFRKFCLTLRTETEWVELVNAGVNRICGADRNSILGNYRNIVEKKFLTDQKAIYGDGNAAEMIVNTLMVYSS